MSDDTRVWTAWTDAESLSSLEEGGYAEIQGSPQPEYEIPVIVTQKPDHGFLPGDRVRVNDKREAVVIGYGNRGYIVVQNTDPSVTGRRYDGYQPDRLTRIAPEPPVAFTEAHLEAVERAFRDAVPTVGQVSYRQYVEEGLARLREGVNDGE